MEVGGREMIRDFSQETVDALYETIRTNIEEEEQWRVFDYWDDFRMEELEIGDYINNIEQYHRHMFDKHDVTTKKFDDILKRVSWVDNLYAVWMSGYRLQLEAFRVKLNSVAEMLNPAMLALNPEKYAAKMEAINTVYQNVKESREQMQQMLELNQQELERQLFEAEASWSEKLEKKADEFLEEACDYLKRSAECFFLGNFTEEVTLLGVGCQIAVGFTGVDLPFDVRDIIADIINLAEAEEWDWGLVGILLLDLCALLPVIGCLKYADEAAVLVKHADEAADLVKHADKLKYVDEAGELLTEGRKLADSGIKELEDAVAEARKLEKELAGSKLLDDVVGDGTDAIKSGYKSILNEFDARGYDDFLHRTDGMFASEQDAQKAFQQLLDRDFEGFAKNFDFSTEPDTAYFWSGDKVFADKIAKSNGGTIMESTRGGQVIDEWDWLEKKYPSSNWGTGNDLDPQPLWRAVSKEYANGVSGKVTYVNQSYEGKVWLYDESPIVDKLMDKGIVSDVDYYNKEYLINKILSEGEKK